MTSRKGLLIDAQVSDGFRLAARQAAGDCSLLYGMHFIPAQMQLIAHRLLAGNSHPVDGEPLEQGREPARWLRPKQFHTPHPMLGAVAAWRRSVQNGPILAGVQV